MPSACPAIPILPPSSVDIATLKPAPCGPSMLAFGMRQPSKMRLLVLEARIPSLSSFLPREKPGVPAGLTRGKPPDYKLDGVSILYI